MCRRPREPCRHEPANNELAVTGPRVAVVDYGIGNLRSVSGKNGHHVIEASCKGFARALRDAVRVEGGAVPSTKGVL